MPLKTYQYGTPESRARCDQNVRDILSGLLRKSRNSIDGQSFLDEGHSNLLCEASVVDRPTYQDS